MEIMREGVRRLLRHPADKLGTLKTDLAAGQGRVIARLKEELVKFQKQHRKQEIPEALNPPAQQKSRSECAADPFLPELGASSRRRMLIPNPPRHYGASQARQRPHGSLEADQEEVIACLDKEFYELQRRQQEQPEIQNEESQCLRDAMGCIQVAKMVLQNDSGDVSEDVFNTTQRFAGSEVNSVNEWLNQSQPEAPAMGPNANPPDNYSAAATNNPPFPAPKIARGKQTWLNHNNQC